MAVRPSQERSQRFMSMISKTEVFSVASSLVGVSYKTGDETALPNAADLAPADDVEPHQLDALFAVHNLTRFRELALRPLASWWPVTQQEEQIENLKAALRELAQSDPNLAPLAGAAGRILSNDQELKRLLRLYKEALIAC